MRRMFLLIFVSFLMICISKQAQAARYFGKNPDTQPSVFTYGFRGLGIGTALGASTGYLILRNDGFEENWKGMSISVGVGALAGGVVGLTTGIIDLNSENPGLGGIILRDIWLGTLFGATAGLIGGAIGAIADEDANHLLLGLSIGALCGAALGVVFGVIEGRIITNRRRPKDSGINAGVMVAPLSNDKLMLLPAFGGSF